MKNTKLYAVILVMASVFMSGCFLTRNNESCSTKRPLFKNYQPRLQGNERWDYRDYQTPKRKLIK